MRLRADQVLMGGVVVIGLWAAGSLFFGAPSKKKDLAPPPVPNVPPVEPARPGVLPVAPQDVGAGPLKMGQGYWGRFDFADAPDPGGLLEYVASLAFYDVRTYSTPAQAAQVIPPIPYVLDNVTPGTRWFFARYGRNGLFERPAAMTYLWPASVPPV